MWPFRPAVPARVPARQAKAMLPLADAAAMVWAAARKERMVIAIVAEADGAEAWFAASIASVVPVYRKEQDGGFAKLDGVEIGSGAAGLYIRKRDYPAYLRWARSVQ